MSKVAIRQTARGRTFTLNGQRIYTTSGFRFQIIGDGAIWVRDETQVTGPNAGWRKQLNGKFTIVGRTDDRAKALKRRAAHLGEVIVDLETGEVF